LKDYRNPHIARVWYEAARALREAKRAIFVGYSMPEDDIDVIYLFKRGLAMVDPRAITVVDYATGAGAALDKHPVGLRFRALFGGAIDWRTDGFGPWIEDAAPTGFAPRAAGLPGKHQGLAAVRRLPSCLVRRSRPSCSLRFALPCLQLPPRRERQAPGSP